MPNLEGYLCNTSSGLFCLDAPARRARFAIGGLGSSVLQTQLLCCCEAVSGSHPPRKDAGLLPAKEPPASSSSPPTTHPEKLSWARGGERDQEQWGSQVSRHLEEENALWLQLRTPTTIKVPSPKLAAWGQQGQCEHGNFSKCLIKSVKWLNICSLSCSCFEEQI